VKQLGHQDLFNANTKGPLISLSHLPQTGILSGLADCWFIADVPLVATPSPCGSDVVPLDGLPDLGAGLL